ncbi:hypothetical protein JTB14_004943 [Gonioctena quinquepunctata]|nr:hypothetical protein JTB14_004943 [Gonioctena quinquepunctata]
MICCNDTNNDEHIEAEVIEQKNNLEQTIHELVEDTSMKEKMIQKMKNDNQILYEEATRIEENLNTIIKKQEGEIEKLRSYIKELKCEITEFTKKKSISTVTQTECIHTQSTYTQTYPSTNSSGTQTSEQTIKVKKKLGNSNQN